jgi:hypothetical protein
VLRHVHVSGCCAHHVPLHCIERPVRALSVHSPVSCLYGCVKVACCARERVCGAAPTRLAAFTRPPASTMLP